MFFKVITKDMLSPGKIYFSYGEGQYVRSGKSSYVRQSTLGGGESPTTPSRPRVVRQAVELSVYFSVSDKNREPTAENCDKAADSPNGAIAMPMVGKDRFENDEVYLSLLSITGCIVNLNVLFPDLKIQNYSRKYANDDYVDEHDFEKYLVCQKWRKLNKGRGAEKNCFINNNTATIGNFMDKQAHRQHALIEKRVLLNETAVQKKKQDDALEHKYRYFMLHRWDLIKAIREEQEIRARKRLNIKRQATKWIKLGLTYLMLKTIHAQFEEHLGATKL